MAVTVVNADSQDKNSLASASGMFLTLSQDLQVDDILIVAAVLGPNNGFGSGFATKQFGTPNLPGPSAHPMSLLRSVLTSVTGHTFRFQLWAGTAIELGSTAFSVSLDDGGVYGINAAPMAAVAVQLRGSDPLETTWTWGAPPSGLLVAGVGAVYSAEEGTPISVNDTLHPAAVADMHAISSGNGLAVALGLLPYDGASTMNVTDNCDTTSTGALLASGGGSSAGVPYSVMAPSHTVPEAFKLPTNSLVARTTSAAVHRHSARLAGS